MIPRAFLLCAALAALAHESRAQLIEVPGDHATVQEAIDAAAPGSTIRIAGGTWGSITITKSLTLLGPALFEGQGSGSTWLAPITLAGPGSGTVVLSDISTGKELVNGLSQYGQVSPGIVGGGFDELHVYDSLIRAPSFCSFSGQSPCLLTGVGVGRPGIQASVPVIVLERSLVLGSRSDNDGGLGYPDGPAGIAAPASTVIALDTTIRGGPSGDYYAWPYGSCQLVCSGGADGSGGAAVVASALFHSRSLLVGGAGATWHGRETEQEPFELCPCTGPAGAQAVTSERPVQLRNTLVMPVPPAIGTDLTLIHTGASGAALLFSSGIALPTRLPPNRGLFFLESPASSFGTIGTGVVLVAIPADPGLIGQELAFQTIEPLIGFGPPVSGVIR